jgi:hypothetical protein
MPSKNTEDGNGAANCMLPRVERSSHSGMAGSKIVAACLVGLFPHMEFDSSGDFSKHYPFFKKMFLSTTIIYNNYTILFTWDEIYVSETYHMSFTSCE